MEKKAKEFYEAPSVEIIEVAQEGFVCVSDVRTNGAPEYNGFNTEEEW